MRVADIAKQVEDAAVEHVVLTGGEPMLFDPIEPLVGALKDRDHTITIETAGTIFRDLQCDLMSISPKLSNSTPPEDSTWKTRHEQTRTNFDALTSLITMYNVQLKFVVIPETGDDLAEIDALLNRLPPVRPDRILLMAEGIDSATQRQRQKALVPICIERGWRISPRLHIDLFGNTRGT